MKQRHTWIVLALLAALPAGARTLTYDDLLGQLTDLDRLTRLQTGISAGQFSSYQRTERESWGANGDAGNYLRIEENGEAVMMEVDGPGCIYRIWSANPQGKLHIYLDGAEEPSYVFDFQSLFTGDNPPFVKPLVYQRGGQRSASDCYVPIPFAKHIKVSADRRYGQYYILDYLRFPDDWDVLSFSLPLTAAEEAELQRVADAWAEPGRDPKPVLPGQRTVKQTVTLRPGQTVTLADLAGPGVIRGIQARVSCEQRHFWRKLVLKGTWDGADWPQVLSPLGPFFGFDWNTAEYGSLIAGCLDGQCYFYYPMPFRQSGKLELTSFLSKPAEVEYEIEWAPVESLPDDTVYFFARWRNEPDSPTFDYPFIETAGQGHLVGITLQIDHAIPGWWGEGDEKVWIDDDQFPSWIGTGSEDYFGDAWGIRYLPGASWGCSYHEGPLTCPYRWHFLDMIPFEKRLRMTIENYGSWGNFAHEHEYNSVAYWYQKELTPPFEALAGVTYIGGVEPGQKPAEYTYRGDLFRDISAADTRTLGLDIPYAEEAEELLSAAIAAGPGKIIDDADRPEPFSREWAVDFGEVEAGRTIAEFALTANEDAVYYPKLYTAAGEGLADLELEIAGERLEIVARPAPVAVQLRGVYLERGTHPAKLVAATAGRAIADCLQLARAPRVRGVLEAEDLPVQRVSEGAPAPQSDAIVQGASAGRALSWSAVGEGQGIVLRFDDRPKLPYVLGLRPMLSPRSPVIQAFVGERPLGPRFDLYAPQPRPGPSVLPLGQLPDDGAEIEIRVVGKNPQATGYDLTLDYFRFEPLLLNAAESAEGVWAAVLRTRACQYKIQNLGDRFLGGHQLWLQPSRRGAFVDIGITLPEAGNYEIVVRYTTSWDYAIVQAKLDDQPLGDPVDCYTPQVLQTEPLSLGQRELTAGRHVLRFEAVDKNPDSKGHLMGIDYIAVR